MVNAAVTSARDAERALAIGYAPVGARPAFATLLALDRRLGELVAGTREPMIAQMRLAWWREALDRLDHHPPPAEPLLVAAARDLLPCGVAGAGLAAIIDGWEHLLVEPLDRAAMAAFARGRGGALFDQAAVVLAGERRGVPAAGEAWALADLAERTRDPTVAAAARELAVERLAEVASGGWPRRLRPLGALLLLARSDLAGGVPGSPGRVARLAFHRLTGR